MPQKQELNGNENTEVVTLHVEYHIFTFTLMQLEFIYIFFKCISCEVHASNLWKNGVGANFFFFSFFTGFVDKSTRAFSQ